jgi:hypothetical protein
MYTFAIILFFLCMDEFVLTYESLPEKIQLYFLDGVFRFLIKMWLLKFV